MTYAANGLLDLTSTSVRAEKVRFDLLDQYNKKVGEIHPQSPASIENDALSTIKRRLTNIRISPDEYSSINPLVNRVRPVWVLSDATEWNLGVFLFADASTHRRSYGTFLEATLVDQSLILAQALSSTLGFGTGTAAADAIRAVFEAAGFYGASIGASTYTLSAPNAFPAGRNGTTYAKVLDTLTGTAGYHSAYFDNDGTPICRVATDLSVASAQLSYLDNGRIIAESMVESSDLLSAPNRFVVIDTAATAAAVTYIYDIPATAPHSYANRNFYLVSTIEAPGVGDATQAAAVAESFYKSNPQAYEMVAFASPADPRHDTFDAVNYRGTIYLETKWTLTLAPGGPMTHELRRVYL